MRKPGLIVAVDEDTFQEGDKISDKYTVIKKIGQGGYGEIYACKSLQNRQVAVKVERATKVGNLAHEEKALGDLKGCDSVPRVLDSGRHGDMVFIVMDLFGQNLASLRRRVKSHCFSLSTTLALGLQMLRCIKQVHDTGYLHRDIKPGNFVIGRDNTPQARRLFIIDFGLSRKHLLSPVNDTVVKFSGTSSDNTNVKPKRKPVRWVGSRRYMSINTHLRKDQGRRDDLWSLLYVLIELHTGTLPWAHLRGIQNLDKIGTMKMEFNNEKLVAGLPVEFKNFMDHIKLLKYHSRPDYKLLHSLFYDLYTRIGGTPQTPYDWETEDQTKSSPHKLLHLDAGFSVNSDTTITTTITTTATTNTVTTSSPDQEGTLGPRRGSVSCSHYSESDPILSEPTEQHQSHSTTNDNVQRGTTTGSSIIQPPQQQEQEKPCTIL